MIVRRKVDLTEFIPSPQEKREGMIYDHVLDLVESLHQRIEHLFSRMSKWCMPHIVRK